MKDGALRISLAIIEGQHLLGLVDEFIKLLDGTRDADDAGLERLTPSPYPDDKTASSEFRRVTREDLLDRRLADALDVRTSLEEFDQTLSPESHRTIRPHDVHIEVADLDAWLRTLSAVRLVVASRLGIDRIDAHDPEDPRFGVYDWLGYRLDQLVELADRHDAN